MPFIPGIWRSINVTSGRNPEEFNGLCAAGP